MGGVCPFGNFSHLIPFFSEDFPNRLQNLSGVKLSWFPNGRNLRRACYVMPACSCSSPLLYLHLRSTTPGGASGNSLPYAVSSPKLPLADPGMPISKPGSKIATVLYSFLHYVQLQTKVVRALKMVSSSELLLAQVFLQRL